MKQESRDRLNDRLKADDLAALRELYELACARGDYGAASALIRSIAIFSASAATEVY